MARPRLMSRDSERGLGEMLVRARALKLRWKILMRRYGLSRTKLFFLYREARQRRDQTAQN